MKDENVYINQILDGISKIESFVSNMTREIFDEDQKTQSAVIMQLMLIGEISKKISNDTKERIDLPWKDIAGFRDTAIHNYFTIDLDIVWNTIHEDIPVLKSKLTQTTA
jgi:uncharacterized protein with HEPN domain